MRASDPVSSTFRGDGDDANAVGEYLGGFEWDCLHSTLTAT